MLEACEAAVDAATTLAPAFAALAALTHLDVDVVGVTAASADAMAPALLQPRLTAARVWTEGKKQAARLLMELASLAACGVAVQTQSWESNFFDEDSSDCLYLQYP